MNRQIQNLLNVLDKAGRYYRDTAYENVLNEAEDCFYSNQFVKCQHLLKTLPDEKQLLTKLVEKLDGKSVAKTLKRIAESKTKDKSERLKGLFSLGTHAIIEMKNNKEYRLLLPMIHEEIGKILYEKGPENV